VDAGPIHLFRSSEELFVKQERKQIPMKSAPTILHVGLDVHKETIAVAIASGEGSLRHYGDIPGHLLRAVDQLLKKCKGPERNCASAPSPVRGYHASFSLPVSGRYGLMKEETPFASRLAFAGRVSSRIWSVCRG